MVIFIVILDKSNVPKSFDPMVANRNHQNQNQNQFKFKKHLK
jgi:hypothetical protein